jgi:hypothetical protein
LIAFDGELHSTHFGDSHHSNLSWKVKSKKKLPYKIEKLFDIWRHFQRLHVCHFFNENIYFCSHIAESDQYCRMCQYFRIFLPKKFRQYCPPVFQFNSIKYFFEATLIKKNLISKIILDFLKTKISIDQKWLKMGIKRRLLRFLAEIKKGFLWIFDLKNWVTMSQIVWNA